MTRKLQNIVAKAILTLGLFAVLGAGVGCDDWFAPLVYDDYFYTDPFDYAYGANDWSFYPDYGLYDPTETIQSTYEYRQDVYDTANAGWSEFIRQ